MKLLFFRLFMLISSTSLLVSCNYSARNKDVFGTVKTRIPAPNSVGDYDLQVTELLGINYLWEMNGQYAQFYLAPDVKKGRLTGKAPHTKFIKSNDLYIAADSLSLQLVTVYSHTQKLALMDAELGVGSVNKWPRDIGVAVRMNGGINNNAFYDGETDSMLFVPYTDQNLPLAVNAGILAHEHFHSLFYKLVTIPLTTAGKNPQKISDTAHSQKEMYKVFGLPEQKQISEDATVSEQSAYHILVMRGLNEGLADFWGWLYTGDTDFIAYSLPEHKSLRSLKTLALNRRLLLYNTTTLRSRVSMLAINPKYLMANLNNDAYTLGTQYSRVLKIMTDSVATSRQLSATAARNLIAKAILKTLENFKNDMMDLQETDFYDPAQFVMSLLSNLEGVHQEECGIVAETMNRNQNRQKYTCENANSAWTLIKKDNPVEDSKVFVLPDASRASR